MFFFPQFIFYEIIYPENDKTGVLEVLKIRTFFPNHGGQTSEEFLWNYLSGFYTGGISVRLSKKKKKKKALIYLSTIISLLEILEGK